MLGPPGGDPQPLPVLRALQTAGYGDGLVLAAHAGQAAASHRLGLEGTDGAEQRTARPLNVQAHEIGGQTAVEPADTEDGRVGFVAAAHHGETARVHTETTRQRSHAPRPGRAESGIKVAIGIRPIGNHALRGRTLHAHSETKQPAQTGIGKRHVAQPPVSGLLGQPQEHRRTVIELAAEYDVGIDGIVELIGNLARRRPVGAEPRKRTTKPVWNLAHQVDPRNIAQRIGEMQEPEVLEAPEGGAVHGLATGTAAAGQDADSEAIDNRLHPCLRTGVLTQQVHRGHSEVPIVDDGVVPACREVPSFVHVGPPAVHQPHETFADLTLLDIGQYLVHQVEGKGERMHVAVGSVEVLLHVVAVVPARRGPEPRAGPPKPARVVRKPPGEGVVLDQGRGLHGGVEGQVELVVGVRAVRPARDTPPRPLTGVQRAVVQQVGEDAPANRVGRSLKTETRIVAGPEQPRSFMTDNRDRDLLRCIERGVEHH